MNAIERRTLDITCTMATEDGIDEAYQTETEVEQKETAEIAT